MLPVSVDYPFFIVPSVLFLVRNVACIGGLPIFIIPSVLCLVPNVACIGGLPILYCPFGFVSCAQCCLYHWIIHSLLSLRFCVLCVMLPVSVDYPFLIVPSVLCLVRNVACISGLPICFIVPSVLCFLRNVACISGLPILFSTSVLYFLCNVACISGLPIPYCPSFFSKIYLSLDI